MSNEASLYTWFHYLGQYSNYTGKGHIGNEWTREIVVVENESIKKAIVRHTDLII